MTREIKFRGKRIDNDEWVYGYFYKGLDTNGEIISIIRHFNEDHGGHEDHYVDPKTVGQFTGLNDKNGKEIYEGDIIPVTYSNCPNGMRILGGGEKHEDVNSEVVMQCGEWRIKRKDPEDGKDVYSSLWSLLKNNDQKEVIGNIYETPDLLPKQDATKNRAQ